jgi:hypothetical protein
VSVSAASAEASGTDGIPDGGGANNVVLAPTFADGSTLVRSNTQVSQTGSNTLASSNIASALATACNGCHSTAVAVQVVLSTGSPQYFVPANAATAVNSGCTACGTFAYAWQYVLQADRPVMLTLAGRQEIQALEEQIDATAASIVPATLDDDLALQAQLDALTSQLKAVVDSEVAQAGAHATGSPVVHVERGVAG